AVPSRTACQADRTPDASADRAPHVRRAALSLLLLTVLVCACGPRRTVKTTTTPLPASLRTPTAAAPATPGSDQAPPPPEGITDPFAYCRVVRDADQPYYLFAPQGGDYAERYRASINYRGPLY